MGILDYVRARVAARIGATVQARLDSRVFRAGLRRAVLASERSRPASGLKDLEAVQRLAGSPVLFAVFDMPWAPFFIFAIYSFHPLLGHLALAGMADPDRGDGAEPDAHPPARGARPRRPPCRATPSPRPSASRAR